MASKLTDRQQQILDLIRQTVARTGFPVPPMDWYFAYNLFRLAGIIQGIKKRVLEGMGLIVLHSGHYAKIFKRLMGTTRKAPH